MAFVTLTKARLQHFQIGRLCRAQPRKLILRRGKNCHSNPEKEKDCVVLCGVDDANMSYLKKKPSYKLTSSFKHFRDTTRMSEAEA